MRLAEGHHDEGSHDYPIEFVESDVTFGPHISMLRPNQKLGRITFRADELPKLIEWATKVVQRNTRG